VPQWYGFCHAWSAAAVMEKEPRKPTTYMGQNGATVAFSIGDLKGLLTACHAQDVANVYGERNNGNGDPNDIAPDELWRLLKLYVQQQHVPLVLDIDPGIQVWNYPVYSYRVTYTPNGRGAQHDCVMQIFMADDAVPTDFIGTQTRSETYKFKCDMNGSTVIAGTGVWDNANHHPDFAWYPYLAVAENPDIDYQLVKKIVGEQRVSPHHPPQPVPPVPDPVPNPNPNPGPPPPPDRRVIAITPYDLAALIADKTSSFDFDITVDKFDGGRYADGEPIVVKGKSARSGYIYLFELAPEATPDKPKPDPKQDKPKPDPKQDKPEQDKPEQFEPEDRPLTLKLLFPLPGQDNRVEGGKPFQFPRATDTFSFVVHAPVGTHKIKAIITSRPLLLSGIDLSSQQQQQTGGQSVGFQFTGTQKQQIQVLVTQALTNKTKPDQVQQITGVKPSDVVGAFAQDETPYYVEPAKPTPDKPKPGPNQPRADK
jgi:hypothetical protein